jgi:UDP-3-O-acyl N-acetylglucosamine deacetylase
MRFEDQPFSRGRHGQSGTGKFSRSSGASAKIPTRFQQTLARPAIVEGIGYWSGREVRVELHPAAVDAGVTFVRSDANKSVRIPAHVNHRVEAPRRTVLSHSGASVEMVEHIMAALAGLQVDNCEVRVNQTEMPGCDGSSLAYVQAIDAAGIVSQSVERPKLVVREVVRVGDDHAWIEAGPALRGGFSFKYHLDYGQDNAIGRQTLSLDVTPSTFRNELASSRTFLLKAEADWLRAQGIASKTTPKDLLIFDEEGPIDNELRFPDECVRHKALDLVGDLALGGFDLIGHFVAHKTGHRLNAELLRALLREGEIVGRRRHTA